VVFNLERIADKATFFEPHQHAEGIEHVLVNGESVVEGGEILFTLPGRVIPSHREGPPSISDLLEELTDPLDRAGEDGPPAPLHNGALKQSGKTDDGFEDPVVRQRGIVQPQLLVGLVPPAQNVARSQTGLAQKRRKPLPGQGVDKIVDPSEVDSLFIEKLHELPAGASGGLLVYRDAVGEHACSRLRFVGSGKR
jgi:hypothetical protein